MSSELILAAKLKEPFGIKGMARIISYLSNPSDILNYVLYDENLNSYKLRIIKEEQNNSFIVIINDIVDRTLIENLNKLNLYVRVKDLPNLEEDEYYVKDMENLTVVDEALEKLGKITAWYNFGAGDIFEITFNDESVELFPFTKLYFPKITKEHVVFVKPEDSENS